MVACSGPQLVVWDLQRCCLRHVIHMPGEALSVMQLTMLQDCRTAAGRGLKLPGLSRLHHAVMLVPLAA